MDRPTTGADSALASYLPGVLRTRIAAGAPLHAPELHLTKGAVLISDVEGFTALVERYGRRGREGLEELTWTLNRYVTALTDIVDAAGGDVLSIAGDALLCYWPAEDTDVAGATLAATHAGFAIQHLLRDAPDESRFDTRIGIGAGDVSIAFVGGVGGRWEVAAGGSAFRDAVAAEKSAQSGEVVLANDAWAHVRHVAAGTRSSDEFVVVGDPGVHSPPPRQAASASLTSEQLRPFLPLSVRERIVDAGDGGMQWLAETRRISVLMTSLPALEGDDAGALARMHEAVRTFHEVIERCEGASRVDIDEKGVLLLAAFGVPPRAHENDAERAAHAARVLEDELTTLGIHQGIGVATGRAFCGAFGSDRRRDYMIRGDVVNLAARLMNASKAGGVSCDTDTVTAVRGRMEFEALGEVTVKGRSEPITIHRPLERLGAAASDSSDMVGRAHERGVLDAAIGDLLEGRGGVVLLEADAGLGKSRLLAHGMRVAREGGVRVLTASADAIERTTSNYAWRQTFTALFGLVPQTDRAAALARVTEHMARFPELQRFTPLLGAVLPVRIDDNELTADLPADVRAENTRQLLLAVLRDAATTTPTMLAVEDAHWLDSGSWALLMEAVRLVHPLLIVVTTRPAIEPDAEQFSKLATAAAERRLRLESLSAEEMTALIARTLGIADVPDALSRFVYERASGHPFFCEELVYAMRGVGAIAVEDGRCVMRDLAAFDLPTTVEGVIVSRLDRLTSAQQRCLKVASVIGRLFRARVLEDAHPVPAEKDHVRDNLRELTALDLTTIESVEPDLAYLFKHVITRDVTYEMMPIAHRQPLHRAVALWHERQFADDLAPHYGILAYHWARAADPIKAVEFIEKAGQHAIRTGGFREGIVLLSQAVELMEAGAVPQDLRRRALWEKSMGQASYYLGDMPGSREHVSRAVAEIHQPVPRTRGAVIRGALGAVGRQALHRIFPGRFLGRRRHEKAILDEAVEGYKSLTQAYYMEGAGPEWLLYLTVNGLNLGDEAGDSAPLARVMINAAVLAYLMGMRGTSEVYARRAIEMAEREGDLSAVAFVWHIRGLLLAQQAEWAQLKEANAKALALVQELGDTGLESEVWLVRSTVAHCEGDFVAAPAAWTGMRQVADRNGNAALRCWSLLDEVDTRLARGESDAAVRALEEALVIPTPESDLGMRIEKLRGIAVTRHRQGGTHAAEALAAATSILDLLQQTPPTGYHFADHLAAAVEVLLGALGQGAKPTTEAAQLLRHVRRGSRQLTKVSRTFVHVQPADMRLRGVLRRLLGDERGARTLFVAAEERAAALAMPLEQGRALVARAQLSAEGDAKALVARANALFKRAGASYYVVSEDR